MQDDIKSLSHSKWRCKYHIVFAVFLFANVKILLFAIDRRDTFKKYG